MSKIADKLKMAIKSPGDIPISGMLSPAVSRIAYVLAAGEPGDVLTDDETREIVGFPVTDEKVVRMTHSAARHVARSADVWWSRVRKEGRVICLDDAGRVEGSEGRIRHIRRTARVAAAIVRSTGDLDPDLQRRRDAALMQAGAAALVAATATGAKLIGAASKVPKEIDELKGLVTRLGG